MQFSHPVFLYITLLLIPLLGLAAFWIHWRRRRDLKAFGDSGLVERLTSHLSSVRGKIRGAALAAGLLLLALALSGPQYGAKMVEVQRQGVDVMIALDVSKSMLAEDVKPNRLIRAQQELSTLVDKLGSDRVGVIAFAGSAQVACPLTTDYSAAKMFLSYITPYSVAVPGTSLGAAIRTAVEAFPKGGEGFRVLVLLTDGEDHRSDPLDAAKEAKAAGVRILAIGFGTPAGEPIPEHDTNGQTNGYVKDRAGQTVVSRLDEDTLKQIAETTQGFYLPAHQGALEAERLAQAIEHMQKRSLSGGRYGASEDRYQYLLLPALLLLLFSFWLPERKKSWLLLLALMLLSGHGWAGTADDVNLGNHAYGKGKFDQALQDYRDAQIKSPNNPVVTYDLGNALHQTGQFKEAEQAYQKVLKVRDAGLRAKTLYNLGNNFVQQGQYEDAVKKYHEALKLKPRDEDTIYNLSQALALMKNPPQKQKDQKNKQDQKNQKGQDKQQQQAQAGQQDSKENKGKDQKGQSGGGKPPSGPDDKGEQKAGQQAGQDTPSAQQHQPKPGEMRKEDAENVLDAVREAERAAWQDRLKQNQNQNPKSGQEDW